MDTKTMVERQEYVPAKIKVIEVAAQRVMCTSTMDSTNVLVLESSTALTLNADGTTFYIA